MSEIDHAKVMEALETMRHVGAMFATMSDAYLAERIGVLERNLKHVADAVDVIKASNDATNKRIDAAGAMFRQISDQSEVSKNRINELFSRVTLVTQELEDIKNPAAS